MWLPSFEACVIVAFGVLLIGIVLLIAVINSGILRKSQTVDPKASQVMVTCSDDKSRALTLPSGEFTLSMRQHAERRRNELAPLLKSDYERWVSKSLDTRLKLLREGAQEVYLAVANYVRSTCFKACTVRRNCSGVGGWGCWVVCWLFSFPKQA